MTLVKGSVASQATSFEQPKSKKIIDRRNHLRVMVQQSNSLVVLFELAWKHRMGILVTGNIILVMNWAVPMWPNMVKGLLELVVR